jgi:hypothetical protein
MAPYNVLLDKVLAVMLGGDHHKEPLPHELPPKIKIIEEFVFSNELRVVHSLFPEKKGLRGPHNLAFEPKYLATSRSLDYKQNLVVVKGSNFLC